MKVTTIPMSVLYLGLYAYSTLTHSQKMNEPITVILTVSELTMPPDVVTVLFAIHASSSPLDEDQSTRLRQAEITAEELHHQIQVQSI